MPKQPVEVVIETSNPEEKQNEPEIDKKSTKHQEYLDPTKNSNNDDHEQEQYPSKGEEDHEEQDEYNRDPTLLRPYKPLDPAPIAKRTQDLHQLVKTIQSHGNNSLLFTNEIRKELDDHIDNLKYVAIAENHFPARPSVLAQKDTGVISLMLEMTLSFRYSVVFGAIDFLALATKHPLCAIAVLSATDAAIVKKPTNSDENDHQEQQQDENDDEHDELNLKPSVATLNLIARAMLKYKNKNELQLSALDLLQNLAFATNTGNSSSSSSFVFPTLDILQSQVMTTIIGCVSPAQQKHNELDPHYNSQIAEKVCRFFQLLVQQRPQQQQQQQQQLPAVADIFANVGDVLPTILRLGNQFHTRPKVAGPVCRILAHMAFNSHEVLALWSSRSLPSITPPSLLGKILKYYAPTGLHSITLDCIRALSQFANHYMPMQINSLILLIRGVMTENGNVEILTTCVACFAHMLRICEKEFEEVYYSEDTADDQKQRARSDMKLFLETLQKEAVPFIGAAYDHFAEDHEDLEMVADAFLRTLGERIRKFYYLPSQQQEPNTGDSSKNNAAASSS